MVKKNLQLLDDEFEKYEEEVKFPSNIPGHVKNKVLDKVRLTKNANITEDMSDEEILNNVENVGEIMQEAQTILIEFALTHMDKDLSKDNLTPSAYDSILEQYTDDIKGVKGLGN